MQAKGVQYMKLMNGLMIMAALWAFMLANATADPISRISNGEFEIEPHEDTQAKDLDASFDVLGFEDIL